MIHRMLKNWRDEEGLATVEYALLLALIVALAVAAWSTFGSILRNKVAASSNSLNSVG
jgi:Flp pilus assembly pilin Flp